MLKSIKEAEIVREDSKKWQLKTINVEAFWSSVSTAIGRCKNQKKKKLHDTYKASENFIKWMFLCAC